VVEEITEGVRVGVGDRNPPRAGEARPADHHSVRSCSLPVYVLYMTHVLG